MDERISYGFPDTRVRGLNANKLTCSHSRVHINNQHAHTSIPLDRITVSIFTVEIIKYIRNCIVSDFIKSCGAMLGCRCRYDHFFVCIFSVAWNYGWIPTNRTQNKISYTAAMVYTTVQHPKFVARFMYVTFQLPSQHPIWFDLVKTISTWNGRFWIRISVSVFSAFLVSKVCALASQSTSL